MVNVISQIIASGLTIYFFALLIRWGKKDAKKQRERETAARKRAWAAEIERAGRRMMEQDAINQILKENAINTGKENAAKKDPPLRKATGFYSGKDAQKILKYKG